MKGRALIAGLAGSAVLTAVHEITRRVNPNAPRMDLLGMQAITRVLHGLHMPVPNRDKLFGYTLAGDVVSNALYYSLAGVSSKKNVVKNATILGLTAGIGAVNLPKEMGLNDAPSNKTRQTQLMTVLLYTIGGLAAGLTMKLLQSKK